jgi:hypothetical protein
MPAETLLTWFDEWHSDVRERLRVRCDDDAGDDNGLRGGYSIGDRMADDYKHIMVESLTDRDPEELVEVTAEAKRLIAAVAAELDRQDAENDRKAAEEKQRRLAARAAAGIAEGAPKKRGPKPKVATTAASEPSAGWDAAETAVELDAE